MKICIIDDDPTFIEDIKEVLEDSFTISWAENPLVALNDIIKFDTDIILLDLDFNNEFNGLDWIEKINEKFPHSSIIVLSSLEDVETVVLALHLGAVDYIEKSRPLLGIKQKIQDIIIHLSNINNRNVGKLNNLVIKSGLMQNVFNKIEQIANIDIPVLITGESGVGKSMIGEIIHKMSHRRSKKFLNVHMPSLSEQLFESDLFGHEKGAFTGADSKKMGKIEYAEGGTILFDEITEISKTAQAKLLRLIEKKEYEAVGNPKTKIADIRIISTTNRDFDELFNNNEFRKDLYYRLSGFEIEIPPLRDRKEDIIPIAEMVLREFTMKLNKKIVGFSRNAQSALIENNWDGNVRELVHTVQKAAIICNENAYIRSSDLFSSSIEETTTIPNYHSALKEAVLKFKKRYFQDLLSKNNGVIKDIAQEADIPRQTVSRILKEVGLINGR